MLEAATLSRRALAALPAAFFAGATIAAPAAVPALPVADGARIDAAAARCRATSRALAEALDAYEHALPAPHFSLDMTAAGRRPFTSTAERRLVDGKTPNRATDFRGNPGLRHVATTETIEQDLHRYLDRGRRRLLYRMRRRAKARAVKIEALEASFRLEELEAEASAADRVLEELAQELFAEPATSMAAVLVQAKALSAYAETIRADHAGWQAGRFGKQLAAGLQNVARAA